MDAYLDEDTKEKILEVAEAEWLTNHMEDVMDVRAEKQLSREAKSDILCAAYRWRILA